MSIERNLNQVHWGVMRTDKTSYFQFADLNINKIDLLLDGTYYGIVGNSGVTTETQKRFHLLGMIQNQEFNNPNYAGRSVFAVYEEDRATDRLLYRSHFVLDGPIGNLGGVDKSLFGEVNLLKNNVENFSVHRTSNGFEMSYLSTQGNSYFRIRYVVNIAGIATPTAFSPSVPAVQMRTNTNPSYRTWATIFNTQLGLTGGTASNTIQVIRPHRTRNNNGWDYLGSVGTSFATASQLLPVSGRVFLTSDEPDTSPIDTFPDVRRIVSYTWQGNVSSTITNNLATWWNSKTPATQSNAYMTAGDYYVPQTKPIQWLNHPTTGLVAIFEKTRLSDSTKRRYLADFSGSGELADISANTSEDGFVLDKMVASLENLTCYWYYDNDRFDNTEGKLVYTLTKKISEKLSGFDLRLLNYDLEGSELIAFNSENNTYLSSYTFSGKDNNGRRIVYINDISDQSFHLGREDNGTIFTDGINNETYYLTGMKNVTGVTSLTTSHPSQAFIYSHDLPNKHVFVGYSNYPTVVGSVTLNIFGTLIGASSNPLTPQVNISFN